jgi:hypothetical protein
MRLNRLSFAGSTLGNGRERSRETLRQSLELAAALRQAIAASGPREARAPHGRGRV